MIRDAQIVFLMVATILVLTMIVGLLCEWRRFFPLVVAKVQEVIDYKQRRPTMDIGDEVARDSAQDKLEEAERTIEWIALALPVLLTMCRTAGLTRGAEKAQEMIDYLKQRKGS